MEAAASKAEQIGMLYIEMKAAERDQKRRVAPIMAIDDEERERSRREGRPRSMEALDRYVAALQAFEDSPEQIAYVLRRKEIKKLMDELAEEA